MRQGGHTLPQKRVKIFSHKHKHTKMSTHLGEELLRQLIMRVLNGLTARQIARDLKINRKTVGKYCKLLPEDKEQLARYLDLDREALLTHFIKLPDREKIASERREELLDRLNYIRDENKRTGVNLRLLWEEYMDEVGADNAYSYASFCRILRPSLNRSTTSYHKHYTPGEVLMVDFAGDPVYYVDRSTGEAIRCVVYVGVLPYSNYTYVEVLPNASIPHLIKALNNNLGFIQGVPTIILTDNMKQMITRPNRYEPDITTAVMAWANHYKTMIQACTVASPRQKSNVEGHVKIIYQRLYAPLRDRTFFSLHDLRAAFAQKLKEHNEKKFQGRTYSRSDQFLSDEINALRPLPQDAFIMQYFTNAKVQKNYHVMLGEDRHFYSVPYMYCGHTVQIMYTTETVQIYSQMMRIAVHCRNTTRYGYSTQKSHMPKNDQHYDQAYGYTTKDFIAMAEKVGSCTKSYIEKVIQSREVEQQAYVGCLGILRLGEKYGNSRLEQACRIADGLERYNYKTIERLLKNETDQKKPFGDNINDGSHENLRGPDAFKL